MKEKNKMDLNAILNKAIYEISVEGAAINAASAADFAAKAQKAGMSPEAYGAWLRGQADPGNPNMSPDLQKSDAVSNKTWDDAQKAGPSGLKTPTMSPDQQAALDDQQYAQDSAAAAAARAAMSGDGRNAFSDFLVNAKNNIENGVVHGVDYVNGLVRRGAEWAELNPNMAAGVPTALLAGAGALALRRRQRAAQGLK